MQKKQILFMILFAILLSVVLMDLSAFAYEEETTDFVELNQTCEIRVEPNSSAQLLNIFAEGTVVKVLEIVDAQGPVWYKVLASDGTEGSIVK